VLARVKQSKDMAYVEATIEKEIADIAAQGVDDKTLGEVLAHARYAFAAELSTPDHVALVEPSSWRSTVACPSSTTISPVWLR